MPVSSAAGMTEPAWTMYLEAGPSSRSLLTVRLSIGPLRNASLRSCMFWIESASIGGLSPAISDAALCIGGVDTADGGTRLTVVEEVNSRSSLLFAAPAIERPDDSAEHGNDSDRGE